MSGFGKTTHAYNLLLRSNYDYYFVFDHDGQFSFRNKTRICETPAQIWAEIQRSGFVVFNPSAMCNAKLHSDASDKEKDRALHSVAVWFCKYAFEMSMHLPGTKMFFCDELQTLCEFVNPWLKAVLQQGRNRGLDFGCCTLHLGEIDIAIRGQFNHRIVFKIEEPTAADYLANNGFKKEEIFTLPKFHFIERHSETGELKRGIVATNF